MTSIGSKSSKKSGQSSMGQDIDLHITNPEIFKASPRPGGFLKILVPPRGDDYDYNLNNKSDYDEADDCRCSSDPDVCVSGASANNSLMTRRSKHGQRVTLPNLIKTSPGREFRLKRAVESKDWTIEGIDDTDTLIEISNPMQDTMNMLAVTISTIMMMAAQVPNIEEVYLDWATQYLNCIVDEDDDEVNRPPNVQGILNHILYLKMGGTISGSDSPKSPKSPPRGSPPSSLRKGSDNRSGSGSVNGGSAGKTSSAGGGAGSSTGGGSNRTGPGVAPRHTSGGSNNKGVSITDNASQGTGSAGGRSNTPNRSAIKSR